MKFNEEATAEHTPHVLPPSFVAYNLNTWDTHNGLRVIFSVEDHDDGRQWMHLSASRRSRVPSYEDLCWLKEMFIGKGRKAVMVFAPESEHVNLATHALHLWACLGDDPLPDFRQPCGLI